MFSLLFILLAALTYLLIKLGIKYPTEYDFDINKYKLGAWFSGVISVCFLVAIIILSVRIGYSRVIDDKINMYQNENSKIEVEISDIVEDYKEYEADVLKECNGKSPITLVQLYPELKSDSLVNSQIKLYKENNQKIKELKLEKINYSVTKWLLYFGGSKN